MNAHDMLEILSKQWCNTEDLKKLTGLGKNNISKLKTKIRKELMNKGYKLPTKLLPMNEVVNYLKIDIEYLNQIAKNNVKQKGEKFENNKRYGKKLYKKRFHS